MNGALLAGFLMTAGVVPAGEIFPQPGDVRLQKIHKSAQEKEWPFVAESGMLSCVRLLGDRVVYFIPDEPAASRPFNIDIDLMSMSMVNLGMTNVLAPYDDFGQLVRRLASFVTMGRRLCDHQTNPAI